MTQAKHRAPRNRTMELTDRELTHYRSRLLRLSGKAGIEQVLDRTIFQDVTEILDWLPPASVDLLFADPPFNINKDFNGFAFAARALGEYEQWLDSWVCKLPLLLKPTASLYICADWRSSAAVHRVMERYFIIQNRITWEREKGRGSKSNWKNCSEDIWFCTMSGNYVFNVQDVLLKRRVLAPYSEEGAPRDWQESRDGRFRLTHPSNLWTDLTVPFWSMPENTDHPTQKPEKLLAKVILASSNPGDIVLDPFVGSGTTSVVAKKLGRHYIGVEIDEQYGCLTEKRLALAETDMTIQGYTEGVFWERNTLADQMRESRKVKEPRAEQPTLL